MGRARLFLEDVSAGELVLDAEKSHYLKNVLRLTVGAEVTLLAESGRIARAHISAVGDALTLRVSEPSNAARPSLSLTLAVATPKGDRADWLVEKLTELGVSRIAWITCERSVVVPKAQGQRMERWQRKAETAARQCGRSSTPEISTPIPFAEWLDRPAALRLIADPSGASIATYLAAPPDSAILLVGPEGGFTTGELLHAQERGYSSVSLAPYTLRVETAAVAGAAVLLSNVALTSQSADPR